MAILNHKNFTAINAVDSCGWTALHSTSIRGLDNASRCIIQRRDFTELHRKDADGLTAAKLVRKQRTAVMT